MPLAPGPARGPAACQAEITSDAKSRMTSSRMTLPRTTSVASAAGRHGISQIDAAARPGARCQALEIRLVRCRERGFLSREPLSVFCANRFRPVGGAAPEGHGCGPRRRKDAVILDRELELQEFALIFRVSGARGELILLSVPLEPLFGGRVIKQPIAFD